MLLVAALALLLLYGMTDASPISMTPLTGGSTPAVGQAIEILGLSVLLLLLGMWALHLPELWSVGRQLWRPLQRLETNQRREEA